MNICNYLLNTILILLIININIVFSVEHPLDDHPIELVDFKFTPFEIKASKPFYYSINDSLRYTTDGKVNKLNKVIWTKPINCAYVSPNSMYILIVSKNQKNQLILLNYLGDILDTINSKHFKNYKNKRIILKYETIQWYRDSKKFYLLGNNGMSTKKECSNSTHFLKYSVEERNLMVVKENFKAKSFFFGKDDSLIFYYKDIGEQCRPILNNYNLILNTSEVFEENDSIFNILNNNYNFYNNFYNYKGDRIDFLYYDSFHASDYLINKHIFTFDFEFEWLNPVCFRKMKNDQEKFENRKALGLFIYQNGIISHVIKAKDGYGKFKNKYYNLDLNGSYFLPGNRYFVTEIQSKEFNGKIAIDTETIKYCKISKNLKTFFCITNEDVNKVNINIGKFGLVLIGQSAEKGRNRREEVLQYICQEK